MRNSNSKKRIRELMDYYHINQTKLCQRTAIQKSALSNYLNGDREPRQDQISAIVDPFGVNPAWLMGYDVPMFMEPAAPVSSSPGSGSLREDEKKLLAYYNLLDAEDRDEARGYIKGLVQSEKYRVDSVKGVG